MSDWILNPTEEDFARMGLVPYTAEEVQATMHMYKITEYHAKQLLSRIPEGGPLGRKANLEALAELKATEPSAEWVEAQKTRYKQTQAKLIAARQDLPRTNPAHPLSPNLIAQTKKRIQSLKAEIRSEESFLSAQEAQAARAQRDYLRTESKREAAINKLLEASA